MPLGFQYDYRENKQAIQVQGVYARAQRHAQPCTRL